MSDNPLSHYFKHSDAPLKKVKCINFGIYDPKDIVSQSVTKAGFIQGHKFIESGITNLDSNKQELQTLSDPRLGSLDDLDDPGNFGHIVLSRPVFHFGLIDIILNVLKCTGYYSHKVLLSEEDKEVLNETKQSGSSQFEKINELIKAGKYTHDTHDPFNRRQPKFTREGVTINVDFGTYVDTVNTVDIKDDTKNTENTEEIVIAHVEKGQRKLKPFEVLAIFKDLTDDDIELLGFNPMYSRPENFIIQVIPIAPPHVRPAIVASETMISDDDITIVYKSIIRENENLENAIKKGENAHIIDAISELLANHCHNLIDNDNVLVSRATRNDTKPLQTITQRLVGKGGRIRGNLMGKRVDFTARSVITADPNLSIDQLGVPEQIAINMTVPERVTMNNRAKLLSLVNNGPYKYPGAQYIITDTNSEPKKMDLRVIAQSSITLRVGDIVERHLMNDDIVIFNRQPSLHKMSMMGHRVKVLPGLTFRLNLSVTTPYNADFDGDEMNMHVPQSIEASTEISELMMTNKVIVSSQDNKPCMGIVQDSLLSSFMMTRRNVLLDKKTFFGCIMASTTSDNTNSVHVPLPSVITIDHKNKTIKEYWSGKQALSLAIPREVNFFEIPTKENIQDLSPNDTYVNIVNGQLISGLLTSKIIGSKEGSVIHTVFNDLGPEVSMTMFNNFQRIANYLVLNTSFSIGVQDIVTTKKMESEVKMIVNKSKNTVLEYETKAQRHQLKKVQGQTVEEVFEEESRTMLTEARVNVGEMLNNNFTLSNSIKCTITAGSKGKLDNVAAISGFVGQQNVNGKRIKSIYGHRTLPHYRQYDSSAVAKGFVEHSYTEGITPQEFFFHAMAGRVSGIDNATLTSSTGYIQRELVKSTEDVLVKYDHTVRNGSNEIVQLRYGYDGIDAKNVETQSIELLQFDTNSIKAITTGDEEYQTLIKCRDMLRKAANTKDKKVEVHNFLVPVNVSRIITSAKAEFPGHQYLRDLEYEYIQKEVKDLLDRLPNKDNRSLFNANVLFKLASKTVLNTHQLSKESFNYVIEKIENAYFKSLIEPGEACGIAAAQAIGEVCTQLSLSSVDYKTTLMIDWTHQTELPPCRPNDYVGKFIDALIEKYPEKCQLQQDGHTIWLPLEKGTAKALSSDEDGNMMWTELEAVTRHLPINKDGTKTLIKIKTKSGRDAICTKNKSFLVYDKISNKIIEKEGCDVKVGDLVPVTKVLKSEEYRTSIDVATILNPREHLFTDFMIEAKQVMDDFDRRYAGRNGGRSPWFHEIKHKVPYTRSDGLRKSFEQHYNEDNAQSRSLFTPGKVFPKAWYSYMKKDDTFAGIPRIIELDRDFGFLVGAFLAEGFSSRFQLGIANNNENYRNMVVKWAEKNNITYRLNIKKYSEYKNEKVNGYQDGVSILMHSTMLRNLMVEICGSGSYEKRVPEFAFTAPDIFVEGLLDGYLCGDGAVHLKGNITACSRSKRLRDGIATLLSRFDIFPTLTENKCYNKFSHDITEYEKNHKEEYEVPNYCVYIHVVDVPKFKDIITAIDYKQQRVNESKPINKRHKLNVFKDVVLDPVIEVEEYTSEYEYVYDLTVEKTRNMTSSNGVVLRDSFHQIGLALKGMVSGVPRLKELLTVTKNPKSPGYAVFLDDNIRFDKIKALKLIKDITYIDLNKLIRSIEIVNSTNDNYNTDDNEHTILENVEDNTDNKKYSEPISILLDHEKLLDQELSLDIIVNKIKDTFFDLDLIINFDWTEPDRPSIDIIIEKDSKDEYKDILKIVVNELPNVCVNGIQGLMQCELSTNIQQLWTSEGLVKNNEFIINASGNCFKELLKYPGIDSKRTRSSDVMQTYDTLGIEASRTVLSNELRKVIVETKYVNTRHMDFMADIMTHTGIILPITRFGITGISKSPIMRASFEKTAEILIKAGAFAERDNIVNVSENILLGKSVPVGTGSFKIVDPKTGLVLSS